MAGRIEEYALIGNLESAALVGGDGSIDWLCAPRFDSDACLAALLGDENDGRWLVAPSKAQRSSARRYRDDTLVLETTFADDAGEIRLTDFMALHEAAPTIVRIVEGLRGNVPVQMRLGLRFGFGDLPPWTRRAGDGSITMTAVGDAFVLRSDAPAAIDGNDVSADFDVAQGERYAFTLAWYPSHREPPAAIDADAALARTQTWWTQWCEASDYRGEYRDAVMRSLITLKALSYEPSGASVAAVTTSLPEALGGAKNWDYRYAWVRDSTFVISAFVHAGLQTEALAWRDWVLCALAGQPSALQIMYGVTGARRIDEYEIDRLAGYANSKPIRIGNAAYTQFQLGIYGDTMNALALAHEHGLTLDESAWSMIGRLLEYLETIWEHPDSGIWELRGAPRHFTLSKAMAWVAFDRAIRIMERSNLAGPAERWRALAARIHADVCSRGFDAERKSFVQSYDSHELDASTLLLPLAGFLPASDERVRGTVAAIEAHLCSDGFVYRTSNDPETAAKAGGPTEGAFLACNFWLAAVYASDGREADARALFERLLSVRNDLGLLAEEYDPRLRRLVGNFPQTFSHASLVNCATLLGQAALQADEKRVY